MPCAAYKSALRNAAAGRPSRASLDRHLAVCADCRASLAAEQELYTSIELCLRRVGNAEIPPSLIPTVRAGLDKQAPETGWFAAALVPVAAALVATLVVAHSIRSPRERPLLIPRTASTPLPTPHKPQPGGHQGAVRPSPADARVVFSSRSGQTALRQNEAAGATEVLVPRDQEELLARYAEQWSSYKGRRLSARLIASPALEPLELTPIQFNPLDVKSLEEAGSR